MTIQRALVILGLVIGFTLLGIGTYFFFFQEESAPSSGLLGEEGDAFPTIPDRPGAGDTGGSQGDAVGEEEGEVGQIGEEPGETAEVTETLTRITAGPISGAFLVSASGSSTALRYIEKETGNLYELKEGETIADRLSNTTIPKIQDVFWNSRGESLVLRIFQGSENAVQNRLVSLSYSTSTTGTAQIGELLGTNLPSTIREFAVSPDGKSLFYINRVGDGVVGITTDFQNKKQTEIFKSLLTEWRVMWPTGTTIALHPKASQKAEGSFYFLDSTKKTAERVISGKKGLTALTNGTKNLIVYSESTPTGFLTHIVDRKAGSDELFLLQTLPEKCAWSEIDSIWLYCAVPTTIPSATYPDDWYKGLVLFNDDIWQINTSTGRANILLRNAGDTTNLMLDAKEENLYFTNKTDETLWKLKIEQQEEEL